MINGKVLVFIFNRLLAGGIETFLLRTCEWCMNNSIRTIFITGKSGEVDDLFLKPLKSFNTEVIRAEYNEYTDSMDLDKIYIRLSNDERLYIMSFTLSEYFLGMKKFKQYRNNIVNHLFYVLHPHFTIPSKTLGEIPQTTKLLHRTIIKNMFSRRSIIFMDETTQGTCMDYYNFKTPKFKPYIIRLPIKLKTFQKQLIEARTTSQTFNILTITRLDFPFKGYVIGLIDDFERLYSKYKNITLTIVGYGSGEKQLNDRINKLPDYIRDKVFCVGKVSYHVLDEYFYKANTYIGMGTTILDAANTSLISIPVVAYQYSAQCVGFFHNHGANIGSTPEDKIIMDLDIYSAHDLIEQVYHMNQEQYIQKSILTYKQLKKHYDINKNIEKIIRYAQRSKNTLKNMLLEKINSICWSLLKM